ncbi:MAG: AbrB family transcriptional regulator [bacterium]|nr:AbrB family transcriptional regulator [bacterium]
MKSKITGKFQITIPKEVREELKLTRDDFIEWKFEQGIVIVEAVNKPFLKLQNSIKVGGGDVGQDIENARKNIAEKAK